MDNPGKILIYSPEFAAMGGIERHLIEVASLLLEERYSITLLSTSNSLSRESTRELERKGCQILFFNKAHRESKPIEKIAWLIKTCLKIRKENWDWIYSNGQGSLFWILNLAKTKKTQSIHHHHTSADKDELPTWSWLYKQYLKHVDELLAVSEQTKKNILEAIGNRPIRRMTCLYPWEKPNIKSDNSKGEKTRLFYAGRLIKEKGIETIIHLSQHKDFSDCEWHIWGEGPHYDEESFRRLSNLYYHGVYHSRKEFQEIANRMDVFALYTTHSEGLPISLLEVTELGIPWIAANRGGCEELALRSPDCQVLPRNFTVQDAITSTRVLVDAFKNGFTDSEDLIKRFAMEYHPERVRQNWIALFEKG